MRRESIADLMSRLAIDPDSLSVHDGQDLHRMEYLAADEEAMPIYLNRVLAEADVILPIAVIRPPCAYDYFGPQGIVPWFLDDSTQTRCQSANQEHPTVASLARTEQGQHLSRLAGVSVVVGCLPLAPSDAKRWVCAPPDVLLRLSETMPSEVATQAKSVDSDPRCFDLIVATIDEPRDQTWKRRTHRDGCRTGTASRRDARHLHDS